tara:strand:+ start:406 stop:639 length:234 start_codon:yes stop_codon:yes gene_type:complete
MWLPVFSAASPTGGTCRHFDVWSSRRGSLAMRIGFIGLGNVGGKLAGSLARNGYDLMVRDLDLGVPVEGSGILLGTA